MDKIQPLNYVVDTDPVAQAIQDVSGWFKTEYMEVKGGTANAEYIEWYMAQGWTLLPAGTSTTTSDPLWVWLDNFYGAAPDIPPFSRIGFEVCYIQSRSYYDVGINIQAKTVRGQYQTSTDATSIYSFSRRKMQSELVLQDMVTDFTKSYNEGREINDQRYDEIVAIWNAGLDKTEDEINAMGVSEYDTIIQGLLDQLPVDLALFETNIDGIMDDYGDSRRTAINVRFDAELAKATQDLIDKGLYTTVLWTTQSAGIEREREQALTDFEDTYIERQVAIELALLKARTDINEALIEANNRWMLLRRENRFAPLELRNQTLKYMLDFMERRTDSYPGLENLAGMAAQLGFSEGASTVAPSG